MTGRNAQNMDTKGLYHRFYIYHVFHFILTSGDDVSTVTVRITRGKVLNMLNEYLQQWHFSLTSSLLVLERFIQ